MSFTLAHNNINVVDLDKSIEFYKQALGMTVASSKESGDGSFKLAFLKDDAGSAHRLELTWLRDHPHKYDLGENEIHLAFVADDYKAAHELHEGMGCICYENTSMGIYFIEDPDGYWLEIVPRR